jgi:hypothetical protein
MFICPKKILMALLFMILASPMAFQAVRAVLGGWISTAEGLPKVAGLAVHAVVFMVLSTLIWRYVPIGSSNFEGEKFGRRGRKRRSPPPPPPVEEAPAEEFTMMGSYY